MLKRIMTSWILTLLLIATSSNAVVVYRGIVKPGITVPGGIYTPSGSEYPEPWI
jgi:hypothetical protein